MAKRSATECAAIMDVLRRLDVIEPDRYESGRELLLRTVSMLTQLARRQTEPGTGRGTGTGT